MKRYTHIKIFENLSYQKLETELNDYLKGFNSYEDNVLQEWDHSSFDIVFKTTSALNENNESVIYYTAILKFYKKW
jgi:hypothetical protein